MPLNFVYMKNILNYQLLKYIQNELYEVLI